MRWLLLGLVMSTSFICKAQEMFTGHVRDGRTDQPLAYAALQWQPNGYYTTTDETGKFQLQIGEMDTLLTLRIWSIGLDTTVQLSARGII